MHNRTILIVDDDMTLTEGLSMALEEEGVNVVVCHDVESAELVIEKTPVNIILSDVKLSGPFGFEGLDFLPRVLRKVPSTPVAIMTGCVDPELTNEALDRGATAVLQKPFSLSELTSMLDCQGE